MHTHTPGWTLSTGGTRGSTPPEEEVLPAPPRSPWPSVSLQFLSDPSSAPHLARQFLPALPQQLNMVCSFSDAGRASLTAPWL